MLCGEQLFDAFAFSAHKRTAQDILIHKMNTIKNHLSFSLGGLLHWGAPVLPVPATHQRDNAKDEQHLDRSHRYSQAPHLLLLLPEPDQVRTSSKAEVDKWFHQVCSTWPPAHAPPHHPQHKSLLCDPGKSRLWKFKVKSFCTHKGNA